MSTSYFARYKTPRSVKSGRSNKPKIRRGTMKPEVSALKRAILNPFATGFAPRIPDGKQWLSTAMKLQSVSEIKFGEDNILVGEPTSTVGQPTRFPSIVVKDTVDLLFFPGFNNMILVKQNECSNPMDWVKPDEAGPALGLTGSYPNGDFGKHMVWSLPIPLYQHSSLKLSDFIPIDDNDPDGTEPPGDPPPYRIRGASETVIQPDENARIDKWRLVSCGLRISCVNNATGNAGWYEASRINIPKSGNEWALQPMPYGEHFAYNVADTNAPEAADRSGLEKWAKETPLFITSKYLFTDQLINPGGSTATTRPPGLKGLSSSLPYVETRNDMENNPTYTSGKLRDMYKVVFKLRPTTDEHDYKDFPTKFSRHDGLRNWPFGNAGPSTVNHTDFLTSGASQLVDETFDAIHIRIHAEAGARIILHYVANQELVYDENSIVQRTATRTVMSGSERDIAMAYNRSISGAAAPSSVASYSVVRSTSRVVRLGNTPRPRSRMRSPVRRSMGISSIRRRITP